MPGPSNEDPGGVDWDKFCEITEGLDFTPTPTDYGQIVRSVFPHYGGHVDLILNNPDLNDKERIELLEEVRELAIAKRIAQRERTNRLRSFDATPPMGIPMSIDSMPGPVQFWYETRPRAQQNMIIAGGMLLFLDGFYVALEYAKDGSIDTDPSSLPLTALMGSMAILAISKPAGWLSGKFANGIKSAGRYLSQ